MRALMILVALSLAGLPTGIAQAAPPMKAFANDAALQAFLRKRIANLRRKTGSSGVMYDMAPPPPTSIPAPMSAPAPAQVSAPAAKESSADASSPQASITNTQEADVDEGGIVKVHGKHLVVLRRGRLFTVSLVDQTMAATSMINAYPPGSSGQGAWYDEMLISGDRVIVIGYSYARGGTEINRFRISDRGALTFEDSYNLRSNDYYSSSNYASRLIGNKLIFYTPLSLNSGNVVAGLPALRRWARAKAGAYKRLAAATGIYLPAPLRDDPEADLSTLHTVTVCDLKQADMACTATGVLGSYSRNFYVSGNAVYVWVGNTSYQSRRAIVYRLPLGGGQPGAVQAWGGPVDQFSFREDRRTGQLAVLVRADAGGDRMWQPEVSAGAAALLTLNLGQFDDGSEMTSARQYRPLPINRGQTRSFHNRFVGDHLIYSAGELDAQAGYKTVFAVPPGRGPVVQIKVPHSVDRIDIIGGDAIVIGNSLRGQLGFSAIELGGARTPGRAVLGDTYLLPAAREGERRSQAFFYRPDADSPDATSGILGLPVSRNLQDPKLARFLGSGSAIAFLRRDSRQFRASGELEARPADARADGCVASCVDWYGNARPIFMGSRIFALMGYELVEGSLRDGRIAETGRLNYAPVAAVR